MVPSTVFIFLPLTVSYPNKGLFTVLLQGKTGKLMIFGTACVILPQNRARYAIWCGMVKTETENGVFSVQFSAFPYKND